MQLQHQLATLQAHGVSVLAVGLDPVATSRALAGRLHLRFPILQDTGGTLGAAFGDYQSTGHAQDNDALVILDAKGQMHWRGFGSSTANVASAVQAALAMV